MLHFDVSANDFQQGFRKVSSMATGLLDTTQAVGSAMVRELDGRVVSSLVHAVEQPIQGLNHAVTDMGRMVRWGTIVAAGWLVYSVMNSHMIDYVDNQLSTTLQRNKRQRLRY